MGSQLRKYRVKAAAAGQRYQAELRANARKVERARRLAEGATAHAGNFRKVLFGDSAPPAGALPVGLGSDVVLGRIQLEERRVKVAHLLGSHEGATELADAIHAGAVARAQASAHPTHEVIGDVWDHALAELRLGTLPSDLTVLRPPVAEGGRGTAVSLGERAVVRDGDDGVTRTVGKTNRPRSPGAARRLLPLIAAMAMLGMSAGGEPPEGDR